MAVEEEKVYTSMMNNNKNMFCVNTVSNNDTFTYPEPDFSWCK